MIHTNRIAGFLMLTVALAVGFTVAGCDRGYDSTPVTSTRPVEPSADVNIDANVSDLPAENRVERRLERRANLREAIDDTDIKIRSGRTRVKID